MGEMTDRTSDPLIGQMLGEYRLKGIVGEGGMGQVYEGLQPVIGKRVAIKLLRRELAADPVEAQRLLQEARTVNGIGHRGIIDIFSFGTTADGRQYFVMEYLSGLSLAQHLKQHGALPVEDTLKLLDEVLAALGAAHAAGVIHRDLKPSNIFIVTQPDGSAFVKLLDFGIAKLSPSSRGEMAQTNVSRIMGTPEFMAPEQARGDAVGPRTDLYALGAVGFEMLTGQRLFKAVNPYELVNQHLTARPRAPSAVLPGLPSELDAVVLGLLEKDPAERPASAEVVRDQLKRVRKLLQLHATQLHVRPTALSQDDVAPVIIQETRDAPVSGVMTDPGATLMEEASGPATRDMIPPVSRRPMAAIVGAGALVGLAVGALLLWPRAVEEEVVAGAPSPRGGEGRGEGLPPPPELPVPEPVVTTVKRPTVMKADPLQLRYRRARGVWEKARSSRSEEDRRIFDVMLDQVGKQLASGDRGNAAEALDDFVQGALHGREP